MFNLALRWKDSELWSSVIFNSGANALQSTFVQKQLVKAWKTFGFVDAVQNGYVSCAHMCEDFHLCVEYIDTDTC